MKKPKLADLYSDYLLTSFGLSSAVGMSKMLDGDYSHDQISKFLAQSTLTPVDFWKAIKPNVWKVELFLKFTKQNIALAKFPTK